MASATHVILVDPAPGAAAHARRRLEELEQRWSRFLPESDVTRANESPEAWLVVSADTVALVAAMKEARAVTHGRYDPTLLGAVVAEGYDTSIDGSGRTSGRPRRGRPGRARRSAGDVAVDPATSTIVVPAGRGLDPGGIGKGLAADIVVLELLEQGTGGALVGVGGDLAAAGTPPSPDGWRVDVEQPRDPSRTLTSLVFNAGGVATSSTLSRAWVKDGDRRHHVIDPGSGRSSATDLAAVTVIARAGWEAEAHATAALLAGSGGVLDYLEANRLAGIATTLAGDSLATPGLAVPAAERSVV